MAARFSISHISQKLGGIMGPGTDPELTPSQVMLDSRQRKPDSIFVAISGAANDGHAHIGRAFENGAIAAIVEKSESLSKRPGIIVEDSKRAMSGLAAMWQSEPSKSLRLIGVTGTNGKTTTNWLIHHALNALGESCMRIGTLGVEAGSIINEPDTLTTPNAWDLHGYMRRGLDGGIKACVLEASSHALAQGRLEDVVFDVAIFTNLTRDHLDYHTDMSAYYRAKLHLFELLSESTKSRRVAVVNSDSASGKELLADLEKLPVERISFGRSANCSVYIEGFEQDLTGSTLHIVFKAQRYQLRTGLIGQHNAENLSGAFGALVGLGYEPSMIISALAQVPQVPGRLESVPGADFGIFVDYAHTPDALENVLKTLRPLTSGKLSALFGCGGDRDKGKRPQMAEIAYKLADKVVITSDNPRTESAERIIADILAFRTGAKEDSKITVQVDRRLAIQYAISQAKPGDIVLIAGKGHENYQIIGTKKFHFSDVEEAKALL